MFAATSGYRNDGDAGLMQVGARYYDAQVGRFITRDTELDQLPYAYCEHDPVNHLDPSGHVEAVLLNQLAESVKGPLGGGAVIGVIGGIIEDNTPRHTILHGIGGTAAGVGTILVGAGIVAAAATTVIGVTAPIWVPVAVAGAAVVGVGVIVAGLYHGVNAWL